MFLKYLKITYMTFSCIGPIRPCIGPIRPCIESIQEITYANIFYNMISCTKTLVLDSQKLCNTCYDSKVQMATEGSVSSHSPEGVGDMPTKMFVDCETSIRQLCNYE